MLRFRPDVSSVASDDLHTYLRVIPWLMSYNFVGSLMLLKVHGAAQGRQLYAQGGLSCARSLADILPALDWVNSPTTVACDSHGCVLLLLLLQLDSVYWFSASCCSVGSRRRRSSSSSCLR